MSSLFDNSKQRRAERAPVLSSGNLNLVPLVDILTSIVFFSLLTYTGAALAALTAFDLVLPPVVIMTPEEAARIRSEKQILNLLVGVRIYGDRVQVEHSEGMKEEIRGSDPASLDRLQAIMTQVKQDFPQNADVTVVPDDDVQYERVIHVLERLKLAGFSGLSLSNRARSTEVANAGGGQRPRAACAKCARPGVRSS
jgi:biopolymer transport protein ExbD